VDGLPSVGLRLRFPGQSPGRARGLRFGLVGLKGHPGDLTLDELITLVLVLPFGLLFAATFSSAVTNRDPLARHLSLLFSPLALTLAAQLWNLGVGPLPPIPRAAVLVVVLAQPVLTLRLVGEVRDIPRWLLPLSILAWAGTSLPLAASALGSAAPTGAATRLPVALVLGAVGVYFLFQAIAAGYLGDEARRRRGSARDRLAIGAIATAALGTAILVAGGSSGAATSAPSAASIATNLSRFVVFLAAAGYLVAFLPPARLRRIWAAEAALSHA
jgi:nitrogen fixation-related uncharacterized protein